MNQKHWQNIETIIDEALIFENSDQGQRYIDRHCDGDKELHQEVSRLYEAINQAETNGFLET